MTSQDHSRPLAAGGPGLPPPGCPAHGAAEQLISMYGPEFAEDPAAVYARMRAQGPVSAVEIAPGVPATLVTGYTTALEVLRDQKNFPKNARPWQQTIPADSPVLPMMMYRPNCLHTDGDVHSRLRGALNDGLSRIDIGTLRHYIERGAQTLLDEIAPAGEADLLSQYGKLLPILVFDQILKCPPHLSERMTKSFATIFDGVDAKGTEQANEDVFLCALELVALRRERPGPDLVSWLIAHPAELSTDEIVHTILLLVAAGVEPVQNLIANTLRLLLSDDRFADGLAGGSVQIADALAEILWTDPPMANYSPTHPPNPVTLSGGVQIPGGRPVLISLAAANTDPALSAARAAGNRAHLAFSAGPHVCPAQAQAITIASVAIEALLDRLPELELAVPVEQLTWRQGPFHRALTALPVRFPVVQPSVPIDVPTGGSRWNTSQSPSSSTPPAATSRPRQNSSAPGESPRWWSSLVRWWRGQ